MHKLDMQIIYDFAVYKVVKRKFNNKIIGKSEAELRIMIIPALPVPEIDNVPINHLSFSLLQFGLERHRTVGQLLDGWR